MTFGEYSEGWRKNLKNENRYDIMLELCEVYKAVNRKEDAILTYRGLLRIYPESSFVQKLLNELL